MNPVLRPGWRAKVESWGFTLTARENGSYVVRCARDGCTWAANPVTPYGAAESAAFHLHEDHPDDFAALSP